MPQHKSKRGLIIGILLALVVILASALGVSLYALARNQQSASTSRAALSTSTPPMPSPTATPNETVLFQDPLTSNTNGWLTNSNCFFQDQSYHVKGLYLCFAPEGNFSDATISVDVQQVSGPPNWGYGLVLRHASPGNFYEFAITTDGAWDFSKVVNDSRTHLVPFTRTAAIYQGLTMINTLQVRAQGSHFVLFINGIQVGAVDDTTFSIGRTGVVSSGADIEVAFNNFKITTVS